MRMILLTAKIYITAKKYVLTFMSSQVPDSPSVGSYTTGLNGQTPTSTRKRPKLLRILHCITEENMTLPTFLEELFKSDDADVAQWTGVFHESKGAERVLKIWDSKLQGGKWEEDFVNSAVDVVVNRTLKHLRNDEVRKDWRLPHTKVTGQKIAGFLVDDFRFLHRYAEGAKYLTRFLKGLLEEDISDQKLSRKSRKRRGAQKPTSVRGCIAAMLIFMSSQKVNAFQTIMGLFLHCTGCPKRVLEVLSGLGLSISYSQVQNGLRSLTKDAREQVKEAVEKFDWYIVYDNLNIANKHHNQRFDKRDTFDNGTAATVILFPSDKDQPSTAPPALFRPEDERPNPVAALFLPNEFDSEVFRQVSRSHVSNAIVRSSPEGSTAVAIPVMPIKKLNVNKTALFPLQTMRLDESTIAGNLAVLERITQVGLQLPKSWFAHPKNTIVAGDQMTVSRLLTLKIHRIVDTDPYHSLAWVHPTLQLFHLGMNLCGTIFRTHFGSPLFPGTLASIIILLDRKRLSKEKQEFKAADELLRIVFDAMVQSLCESLREGGASDELDIPKFTETITNSFCGLPSPSLFDLPCTTVNINALLFLRDVAVHIELTEAIKAGDIGRISHLLPIITLMMHGGGNTNYALELLRLLYGFRHLWTDEWATRVLSSMLVNPKGVEGGWMATDMLQENHNYLIKSIFSSKGSNMTWEYLRDAISTNIRTFQAISWMFEREVGVGSNSTKHKKPSTASEISKIQRYFRHSGILCKSGQCNQGNPVVDLQGLGGDKMVGGSIVRFLDRHQMENAVDVEETEALEHMID
ncbi:hypothetical protein BGZ54_002649 [Gamsiella multidivaricata]|nr:hypothetical protein BGZ54_002649 [Gamsiella multidivaricata]